jgi:hypothetical protein
MMNGLMPVPKMAKLAQKYGLMKGFKGLNTVASLGIGTPPSDGCAVGKQCPALGGVLTESFGPMYTWKDLLCKMSPTVKQSNAKYNIMNIGGWGPGNTPIRWQKSDIPNDDDIREICAFMKANDYDGISFDIEGVYDGWKHDNCDKLLSDACGKIKKQGFMVWIVIPAFNVKTKYGGPIAITNPDNITLVQLMCYGRGLDSRWGGDPNGAPMTSTQVMNTLNQLKGQNVPKNKIMLAWSYMDTQESYFEAMIKEVGPHATAGCFAWCYGNEKVWGWTGKKVATGNLGSCAGGAGPGAQSASCDSFHTQATCPSPQCTWGKNWSGGVCGCRWSPINPKLKCD